MNLFEKTSLYIEIGHNLRHIGKVRVGRLFRRLARPYSARHAHRTRQVLCQHRHSPPKREIRCREPHYNYTEGIYSPLCTACLLSLIAEELRCQKTKIYKAFAKKKNIFYASSDVDIMKSLGFAFLLVKY